MYLPDYFENASQDDLLATVVAHPFGVLVMNGPSGLDANHLPFLVDEGDPGGEGLRLLGHVARSNPLWEETTDGDEALVIFRAGDAYISPNWYPSKHQAHRQVPTWNYRVVHVHGHLHVRDDERFLRGVVARLTRIHERRAESPRPWKMTDSSPAFIDQMLANIVGIEVRVTRVIGKWKLSQNKEEWDRLGAADELGARGEQAISAAMRDTVGGKQD